MRIKLSEYWIYIIVIAITVFLLSGSIYVIVEGSQPYLVYTDASGNRRIGIVNPTIRDQVVTETLTVAALYTLSFIGLAMIAISYKYSYDPRTSNMLLVVGLTMLLISSIILYILLDAKLWRKIM
ncbi:MAG: hypothetical protein QXQ29_02755 [Candidatus Bathyarchaeia archaeon]